MSDFDLPDLPSDEELGITDEDREKYEKDLPDDGPEMTDKELAALLGETPAKRAAAAASAGATGAAKTGPTKKQQREEKKRAKEEKKRLAREEKFRKKAAKAIASASKPGADSEKAEAKSEKPGTQGQKSVTAGLWPGGKDAPPPGGGASPPSAGDSGGTKSKKKPLQEGPRSRWMGPATLVVLVAMSWVASTRTGQPSPVPANAPDTVFSSSRAMSMLVEMAREAHPPGSPEHERVRGYLVDRLEALGLETEVQTTTSVIQRPGRARAATVRNIVARLPGTEPSGSILVTAHYDSREIAIGAADDGSGIVTILEAIRALQAGPDLANDVIVLFTDAEELGLLGARAFVAEHPLMDEVDLVLSFEMRGSAGPSIMFETNQDNGWVIQALKDFDTHPFATSLAFEIYQRMPNDTDFTPFREAGVQGLNFAAIDNAHVYHQEYDTPDNLSESAVQHHGIHALGALKHFGDADLTNVNAPNLVYFTAPGLGMVAYDPMWVLPLSGLLVVAFVGLLVVARRGGARLGASVAGLLVSLLAGGLAFGAAYAGMEWLPGFHPETVGLHGSLFHSEGWYVLALASVSLGIVTGLAAISRRWISPTELGLGAIVVPLIGAVALSVVAPLGGMILQWPVLAALAAMIVVALLGPRADGLIGWVAVLLLAAPVILLILPVIELLWFALTLRLATALAVLMTMGLLLCLPALGGLRHPNSWWAPVTSVGIGAIALGVGIYFARPSDSRPTPTTLVYAYEHGTGAAYWATDPEPAAQGSPVATWVAERVSAPFDETTDLTEFGYRPSYRLGFTGDDDGTRVARAQVVEAAPPAVDVIEDSITGGERSVALGVRSLIGAEMLGFQVERGTRIRAVNGIRLEDSDALEEVEHWGEPESYVRLDLIMPADEPIGLHIVEHLLRPEELLGEGSFQRPADLAPNVNRLSDRAMFRYSVGVFVDPRHAVMPTVTDLTVGPDASVGADTLAVPDTSAVPDSLAVPNSLALPDTSAARDTLAVPDTSAEARRLGGG